MRYTSSQQNASIAAPAEYSRHYTDAEFKFRWLDALKEETDPWRTGTDLFVALMLSSHMSEVGRCHPGIPTIAAAMKKSESTVRKSIHRLEANGWLHVVPRKGTTNEYTAVLPTYGLNLLLDAKGKSRDGASAEEWTAILDSIIQPVFRSMGASVDEWTSQRGWAQVEGRLRQVIQRMGGPTADVSHLQRFLLEEIPEVVHSPVGYLLHRLSAFTRLHPTLAGRKTTRVSTSDERSTAVFDIIRNTAQQLASKQSKGAGPREPAPSY